MEESICSMGASSIDPPLTPNPRKPQLSDGLLDGAGLPDPRGFRSGCGAMPDPFAMFAT